MSILSPVFQKNNSIPFDIKDPSLVLYLPLWYPYSDMMGSTIYSYDRYRRTGTVTGTTWNKDGRVFDGDDWIVTSDTPFDFERTDAFAIGVRMKTTSTTTGNPIAKQANAGDFNGYAMEMNGANGRIAFYMINDVSPSQYTRTVGTTAINDGEWHTIFVQNKALNGGNLSDVEIYVDGKIEAVSASTDTLGTNSILTNVNLRVGSRDGGGQPITATIKEVWVYNRYLSAGEQLNIHSKSASR